MVCPNCGKASADEKFCSNCGQEISPVEEIAAVDFPEPPIGRYEGIDGYIDLSFCTLTIRKEILGKTVEHAISFDDVTDVIFHQASDKEMGYLAIREKKGSYLPIESELDASCDEKALVFGGEMNDAFSRVYHYLVLNARLNRSADKSARPAISGQRKIRCPKCSSETCHYCGLLGDTPGFYGQRGVVYVRSSLIMFLRSILYLCRVILARKKVYECLDCGHSWIAWRETK